MNWGSKILILYLGFVGLILALVFTCFGHKTELEFKDYYAREIKFQEQLDAGRNADLLSVPIKHQISGRSVEIVFPGELCTAGMIGDIHFLRPSDSRLDRTFAIAPEPDGKQVLNSGELSSGVYKMRITFSSGGKNYYKESILNLK